MLVAQLLVRPGAGLGSSPVPSDPMMLHTLEEKQNFALLLVSEQKKLLAPEAKCAWPHSGRDQPLH